MTRPTVLVTGAATGIGRSVARSFADDGHPVVGTWHRQPPPDDPEIDWRRCDVGVPGEVDALVTSLAADDLAPDIVVSNAAVLRIRTLGRMSDADFADPVDTNLGGAYRVLRATAAHLARRRWGRVVFVGSAVATTGTPAQTNYVAAKAGLVGLARSAGWELGRRGVTVNVVEPGLIDTPLVRERPAGWWDDTVAGIPGGRAGEPDEVAALIRWLCSDAAASISGAVVRVDGGMLAAAAP